MMKGILQKIIIVGMFLTIGLHLQARQLVISKNGEVKYVMQDHQIVDLTLTNGHTLHGMLTILSDSTLKVNEEKTTLSAVYRVKVTKGSRVGKGIGIAGLIGGTSLIIVGGSMMSDDGILGFILGTAGIVSIVSGVVIDALAFTALTLSREKWVYVSKKNYHYQINIL